MAVADPKTVEGSSALQRKFLFYFNIFLALWFGFWTVVTVISLPVFFFRYGWRRQGGFRPAMRRFVQFYGRCIIRLFWPVVKLEVENVAAVRHVDPCVYVLNHFSFVDIFFCGFLPGFQTVIAIRSWPFHVPVFNLFMRWSGYMDVEAIPCEKILSRAAGILRSGACLLFFPEGHRSRTGRLLPLRRGAFRIAAENDVPLVPVTLEGTEYLGGFKSRWLTPCRVRMRFYPPLKAECRSRAAILDLQQRVEALFQREVYSGRQPTPPSLTKEG